MSNFKRNQEVQFSCVPKNKRIVIVPLQERWYVCVCKETKRERDRDPTYMINKQKD